MSILRAGDGILEGMLDLVPSARVGHVGLYRDPATLAPVEYYLKLPEDIRDRLAVVVDPMLATGGTLIESIRFLYERGAARVTFRPPQALKSRLEQAAERDLAMRWQLGDETWTITLTSGVLTAVVGDAVGVTPTVQVTASYPGANPQVIADTLGAILKYQDDIARLQAALAQLAAM